MIEKGDGNDGGESMAGALLLPLPLRERVGVRGLFPGCSTLPLPSQPDGDTMRGRLAKFLCPFTLDVHVQR